jgi:divalent metal cation (Fe/Co/Zn/Cd) transporter
MIQNKLIHTARWLSFLTIFYNVLEGLISIYFGIEEESLSLLGFGLDSFVEVASASIVLLKLQNDNPNQTLARERRATFWIGVLFLLLASSIMGSSAYKLWIGGAPETTVPGIVISLISLGFMFYLYRAKLSVGFKLDSATIMADARCSLACIKLSFILLAGSLLFFFFPFLWWLDSVAATVLSLFIFLEGFDLVSHSRQEEFKGGCGCH